MQFSRRTLIAPFALGLAAVMGVSPVHAEPQTVPDSTLAPSAAQAKKQKNSRATLSSMSISIVGLPSHIRPKITVTDKRAGTTKKVSQSTSLSGLAAGKYVIKSTAIKTNDGTKEWKPVKPTIKVKLRKAKPKLVKVKYQGKKYFQPPRAPQKVTAMPGDASATVSWKAPVRGVRADVMDYTITSIPAGAECVTAELTCTLSGLTNMTNYKFQVVARNEYGAGAAATSAEVMPHDCVPGPNRVLRDCSFPQRSLIGIDFSHSDLTGANLSGAALEHSVFDFAILTDTDFTGANLRYSDLSDTQMDGAIFANANLTGVHGLDISGTPASLPGVWRLEQGALLGPEADISTAEFRSAQLSGLDLSGAKLLGVVIHSSVLNGTDLGGADLSRAVIDGSNMKDANLAGATLDGAALINSEMTGTVFDGATFAGTDFSGSTMDGVNLAGLDLVATKFVGTRLPNAQLAGANLRAVDFTNAYLRGANLAAADLRAADLNNVDLSKAILTGVRSGGITGRPAALPEGWTLDRGVLHGPPTE